MGNLSKKTIVLVIACLALVIGYFVFLFFTFFNQGQKTTADLTASSIEAEYSRINELVPGKSTLRDVISINGAPTKTETIKTGESLLYYDTPTSGLKNTVLIKNDVVVYAAEHVFGDYRGNFDKYTTDYGQPSLVLYQGDYPWHVFLNQGLMIQSANNFITMIVYFVPQRENDFFGNIAPVFDLSRENLESSSQGEAIAPQP